MQHPIRLTADAERDLTSVYSYIAGNDSASSADNMIENIKDTLRRLQESPGRGNDVKELLVHGIKQFRETYFKPYRVIYRILDEYVIVYLIADERRDMQTLLQARLLG